MLALAVAAADTSGRRVDEALVVTHEAAGTLAIDEVRGDYGGRLHIVECPMGPFEVEYSASVEPADATPAKPDGSFDHAALVGLRQSRYCPSDTLEGFASSTFDTSRNHHDLAHEIAGWVFSHIRYELGSSGPSDTAIDTLLGSRGVCRDLSHLTIALCRASGIPARLAAVFAPGLTPMDFHAVVEVLTEEGWEVLDPSRLAPRQSLVRIATGRDAADTAFATTLDGDLTLQTAQIMAVVDGDLPLDEHDHAVFLA